MIWHHKPFSTLNAASKCHVSEVLKFVSNWHQFRLSHIIMRKAEPSKRMYMSSKVLAHYGHLAPRASVPLLRQSTTQSMEVGTRWMTFCRRHFQMYFLGEKLLLFYSKLKFVHLGSINNKSALITVMAWYQIGDKPLPEPKVIKPNLWTPYGVTIGRNELNHCFIMASLGT